LLFFGGKISPISPFHKKRESDQKKKKNPDWDPARESSEREGGPKKNNNAQSVLAAHDTNSYYQSLT
jgi:hypothetical protein